MEEGNFGNQRRQPPEEPVHVTGFKPVLVILAGGRRPPKPKCTNSACSISPMPADNGQSLTPAAAAQQMLTSNQPRQSQARKKDNRWVCRQPAVGGRKANRNQNNHPRPLVNAKTFHNKCFGSISAAHRSVLLAGFGPRYPEIGRRHCKCLNENMMRCKPGRPPPQPVPQKA